MAVSPGFNINPILGDFSLNAVPEPSSLVLAVLGFVGVAAGLLWPPRRYARRNQVARSKTQ